MAISLAALNDVARSQDGIFLLHQARECGVGEPVLRRLRVAGEVERVHRGCYRLTAMPWSWAAKQRAAVLGAGPGACASHAGAARWLGLDGIPAGRPEVTVIGRHLRVPGARVHRMRALPDEDVTIHRGLRCTTGSRTLIDLAARLDPVRLVAATDDAICAGIARRAWLHTRAAALTRGRKGVQTLVDVTAPDADGVFWSALERLFGAGVRDAGLPHPEYNARLAHRGRTYFADALWRGSDLVVELRGLRFHATPAQRGSDDERLNAFTEMGLRTLVFGWAQVKGDFADVAEAIREALSMCSV